LTPSGRSGQRQDDADHYGYDESERVRVVEAIKAGEQLYHEAF